MSQTITVPTVGTTAGFTPVQNYSYDSLNRFEAGGRETIRLDRYEPHERSDKVLEED